MNMLQKVTEKNCWGVTTTKSRKKMGFITLRQIVAGGMDSGRNCLWIMFSGAFWYQR
jgi:hypothetical protein